ncbi:MAG TPA: hypothetical protein VMF03_02400 [Steroidobacteraceae bacterium]|nr:hypothetical protein [Steroidobacteraceae bacterium]
MAMITDRFSALLADFDLTALDRHASSVLAVDRALSIGYLNDGWFRFAAENGGEPAIAEHWGLGSSLWSAIPAPLQGYFANLFARAFALNPETELHPLLHHYECSSPERHRHCTLGIYSLKKGEGLLLVHSVRVERPWSSEERETVPGHGYTNQSGLTLQCSNCRRVRFDQDDRQWHYVPDWIRTSPPKTSHGLCPVCLDYYYPGSREP